MIEIFLLQQEYMNIIYNFRKNIYKKKKIIVILNPNTTEVTNVRISVYFVYSFIFIIPLFI